MRTLILLLSLSLVATVQAAKVEVVGQAPMNGALSYVREQAMQDAMQKATLRSGVQVSSTQILDKGVMAEDEIQVRGKAQVSNVEVLWEDTQDGYYQIAIRADVAPQALCPKSTQQYRKSVAITGFNLAKPEQASIGWLGNVEQDLPHVLANSLNDKGRLHALDASQYSLYANTPRAPTTSQPRLTTSAAVATELGAQYVVSGVVRDLALLDTGNKPSWRERLGLPEAAKPRQFVLDVFIHDGLSGALISQQSYSTMGSWNISSKKKVGFASPEFWHSPYGAKVRELLSVAVNDINETLRCQPFMARITKTEGNRLYIETTAGSGLRPGDKLKVYRTGTFYNIGLEARTELTNMMTEAVVKQVQPQFVIAELPYDGQSLAIQRDDMVVAW